MPLPWFYLDFQEQDGWFRNSYCQNTVLWENRNNGEDVQQRLLCWICSFISKVFIEAMGIPHGCVQFAGHSLRSSFSGTHLYIDLPRRDSSTMHTCCRSTCWVDVEIWDKLLKLKRLNVYPLYPLPNILGLKHIASRPNLTDKTTFSIFCFFQDSRLMSCVAVFLFIILLLKWHLKVKKGIYIVHKCRCKSWFPAAAWLV